MARVESLKRKMTRLIIAIIVVSVGLVFLRFCCKVEFIV